MTEDRPIYIDIDGTLTDQPVEHWGTPWQARLAKVRRMLAEGVQVVIWSGGGTTYARAWAERHGLAGAVCIGKPEFCVDDNPTIRPVGRMRIVPPTEFFE